MKRKFVSALIALAMIMLSQVAIAQSGFAKLEGKASDEKEQPIVGARVELSDQSTGKRYTLKTDKKGEYSSIAISPGTYRMVLSKDDKEIIRFDGVGIRVDSANVVNFDLK